MSANNGFGGGMCYKNMKEEQFKLALKEKLGLGTS